MTVQPGPQPTLVHNTTTKQQAVIGSLTSVHRLRSATAMVSRLSQDPEKPPRAGFSKLSFCVGRRFVNDVLVSQALTDTTGASWCELFSVASGGESEEGGSKWCCLHTSHSSCGCRKEAKPKFVGSPLPQRPWLTYEEAVWIGYGVITILSVCDRFEWNVWPRQSFSIGGGSAGNDRLSGFKPGPWSVVAYDILARISGRFSILAYNLMLLTRMRFIETALVGSWIDRRVIDCSDIVNSNLRLHKWNGISLCILTLIHVWSILFPCIFHGWKAQIVPGYLEWPLSERSPAGFQDANAETRTMSMQVDDVFRMVEMTLLLAILTPLSIRWLATRWHAAIHIHRFISVVYFVDIVRRHSHPHSWILNTPVFVLWVGDKVWSNYMSRRCDETETKRIKLGEDYMVLYWKYPSANFKTFPTVGPDFFLRESSLASRLEHAHVFTTFGNRLDFDIPSSGTNNRGNNNNDDWSFGAVIRVFRNRRAPRLPSAKKVSHTRAMYDKVDSKNLAVTAWGPYHGEMSELVRVELQDQQWYRCRPLVLIGAGSGINYLLDALQWIALLQSESKVTIQASVLFSTRDIALYEWACEAVSSILGKYDDLPAAEEMSSAPESLPRGVKMVLAMTGGKATALPGLDNDLESSFSPSLEVGHRIVRKRGRIQFDDEIQDRAIVFAQGSSSMKESVRLLCRKKRATFHGGRGGQA